MTTETFKARVPIKKKADRNAVASRAIPKKTGVKLARDLEKQKETEQFIQDSKDILFFINRIKTIMSTLPANNPYYSFMLDLLKQASNKKRLTQRQKDVISNWKLKIKG